MDFLAELPNTPIGWTGFAFGVVFLFMLLTDRRRKQISDINNSLISALENKVTLLTDEVTVLRHQVEKFEGEIKELTRENNRLADILKGKDEVTKKFQEEGFQAMKKLEIIDGKMDKVLLAVSKKSGR